MGSTLGLGGHSSALAPSAPSNLRELLGIPGCPGWDVIAALQVLASKTLSC